MDIKYLILGIFLCAATAGMAMEHEEESAGDQMLKLLQNAKAQPPLRTALINVEPEEAVYLMPGSEDLQRQLGEQSFFEANKTVVKELAGRNIPIRVMVETVEDCYNKFLIEMSKEEHQQSDGLARVMRMNMPSLYGALFSHNPVALVELEMLGLLS